MYKHEDYFNIKELAHIPDPVFTHSDNMSIQHNPVSVKSTKDPSVWGPSLWLFLHISSAHYPIHASNMCKERAKWFIRGIPMMLPCESCANHAQKFIESNEHRLDTIVSSRENLFKFFVDFHNYVNARFSKSLIQYDEAFNLYTQSPVTITRISYK